MGGKRDEGRTSGVEEGYVTTEEPHLREPYSRVKAMAPGNCT